MVPNTVCVAVGILGNGASMLLYAAPILTFRRAVKKGNVEEFSCVPYVLALFNFLLYTWYGLPVVSSGWENTPVSTINEVGILLEITFISIYIWFAPSKKKMFALQLVIPVVALFGLTTFFSCFMVHTHRMRKVFVGSVGLVASISMYSSPMVAAVSIKYYYVALTVVQQLMIKPHPELIMSDGFVSQSMDLNHYQLRLQTDTVSVALPPVSIFQLLPAAADLQGK